MKGVWSYIKDNFVVWIYYLIIVFFSIYFIVGLVNYRNDIKVDDSIDILQRFDLVVVPLSAISILIGLISSKKNSQRELNIQKAKITMDFSNAYREMMDDMYYVGQVSSNYMFVNKKIGKMFKYLQNQDKIYFDEFWFEELLKKFDVTHDEIKEHQRNASENNRREYTNICQQELFLTNLQGSGNNLLAYETNKMMSDELLSLNDEIVLEEEKLKDSSLTKDEKKEIKELLKSMNAELDTLEIKFSFHNRLKVTDILNSLEVLCSSVKFNLIGYDQIYHLIVNPFNGFMTSMYFDIMGSKIAAEKESYYLYTNIILMYENLSDIRLKILKDNQKDAVKNKRRIKRRLGKFGQKDILKMK